MLGLTIVSVEISANTNGGVFSEKITFEEGLNIIRAENSSGKSTCINSLAYGLGLEAILGPGRKRPFPKSLYEEIYDNKVDKKPYWVSSSSVCMVVRNSENQVAKLTRDILGKDKKIVVKTTGIDSDYFLGSSGEVGSAKSERGFHNWLAEFIGWKLPNVVKFDGGDSLLYLECIFPLFFVEQKRGWSEIQANIPTQYGIQNVKKSASEFCLGIDSFDRNKKLAKLKGKIDTGKEEWDSLRTTSEGVADYNSVRISKLVDLDEKSKFQKIDFMYLENNSYISISAQEKSLKRLLESISGNISGSAVSNEKINSQASIVGGVRREIGATLNSIESTFLAITDIDFKLKTLRHDLDQYQQLRRLRNVGSDISEDLNTEKCPICESDILDTLSSSDVKRAPMTLGENIEFLKNQIDFFSSIKIRTLTDLKELQMKSKLLSNKIDSEQEKLDALNSDMNDTNGDLKAKIREKIEAEIQLRSVTKLKQAHDELNNQSERIFNSWKTAVDSLKLARKDVYQDDRSLVIRKLEGFLKENLASFGFNPTSISTVSVSPHTLRPEQEGYDIVAETSASDYIRIIWSYTLALLEFAGMSNDVKHGGFVVFDEPRQHEANKISFASLIKKASECKKFKGQVIFATSLDRADLHQACEGLDVKLNYYDDYILTLKKTDESLKLTGNQ